MYDKEFDDAVRPLIKYLAEKRNHHVKVIVDSISAELVVGEMSINTTEYLKD